MSSHPHEQTLVLFDGVCHLCNGFINFLIERNPPTKMKFAPIQGETAKKILNSEQRVKLDTIYYYREQKLFTQSEAVLEVLYDMGGKYRWFSRFALFIPGIIRNIIYNFIANNRYSFFGQSDVCRIPTAEEKKFFLD